MKKIFAILMVLSLAMFAACAAAPPPAPPAAPANMPPWVNDIAPEDVFWGIGVASQSTVHMSLTMSEARGRVGIARQLSTRVQSMLTDYNLDAGPAGHQVSTSMQEEISRLVTDMDVSGARPIQRWTAPDGLTVWTLVEMNRADARSQIASILGNQEAQFAQFRAQQALAMLDAQLAGPQPAERVEY